MQFCAQSSLCNEILLQPSRIIGFLKEYEGFLESPAPSYPARYFLGATISCTLWPKVTAHGCRVRCPGPGFGRAIVGLKSRLAAASRPAKPEVGRRPAYWLAMVLAME